MEWSPQQAMEAYLETLQHLRKVDCNGEDQARVIEPNCMELISAMAAGKGAKRILEITTQGITPLTIALAVAAKHTGGQLICILTSSHVHHRHSITKNKLHTDDLQRFIKVVHAGNNPCEILKQITQLQLKNVDFAVIDSRFDDDYLKPVFRKLDADVIKTVPIQGTEMRRVLGCSFRRRNRFLVTLHE